MILKLIWFLFLGKLKMVLMIELKQETSFMIDLLEIQSMSNQARKILKHLRLNMRKSLKINFSWKNNRKPRENKRKI